MILQLCRKDDIETSVSVEEDLTGLVGTALYTAPEVLKVSQILLYLDALNLL